MEEAMTLRAEEVEEYTRILGDYLGQGSESALAEGYELARRALMEGCGVVELAEIHHQSLQRLFIEGAMPPEFLEKAGGFLAECLSPFQMSHRGAQEGTRALRHLNEAMEAELKRITHTLHSDAGQLLALVHIALADVMLYLPRQAHKYGAEVQRLLWQLESALRNLSYDLRPTVLDNLGLLPALEFLAERVSRRTGLAVLVEGHAERRPPPRVETAIYRIVQEALSNAARHAAAHNVMINLECTSAKVACRIRDDGKGIALREEPGAGMGLLAIRERLNALGGSLKVVAEPGSGTTILTDIPLGG
jgi:signal transduction histidine kinase